MVGVLPATWWVEVRRVPLSNQILKCWGKNQPKAIKNRHSLRKEEKREGVYPEIQNQRSKQERMLRALGCETRCRSRWELF